MKYYKIIIHRLLKARLFIGNFDLAKNLPTAGARLREYLSLHTKGIVQVVRKVISRKANPLQKCWGKRLE
jgi:hypothetical protein